MEPSSLNFQRSNMGEKYEKIKLKDIREHFQEYKDPIIDVIQGGALHG
jgi:hypothetical protein